MKDEEEVDDEPPPSLPRRPIIPRGRFSNDLVHALAVEAVYAGYSDTPIHEVDLHRLQTAYSKSKGQDENVKLAENWLAARFFYQSEQDLYGRSSGGQQSAARDLVKDSAFTDNRFLCLPMNYRDDGLQLEEAPIRKSMSFVSSCSIFL